MGKIAIVTGASRGIGKAIAIKLTNQGYAVVGVYEKSHQKAKEIEKKHKNIIMVQGDIGSERDIKRVVNTTVRLDNKVDVVVNSAGINLWGPVRDYSLKDWNRMLNVNLTAKFLFSKYTIPYLEKSENGVIINISSRLGLNEYTFADFVSYGVTNAAINNFTVALSKELKPLNIRVNAVIPTVTNTDRFQKAFTDKEKKEIIIKGKLGTPEEVAEPVWTLINGSQTRWRSSNG